MREILFRGKRIDNGEWVYGYYLPWHAVTDLQGNEPYAQIFEEHKVKGKYVAKGWVRVKFNTVGQFTGLTDKNGNKIFEGDIVKIAGDSNNDDWKNVNYIAQIVFLDGGFCAIDETIDNYSFRRYSLSRCEFDLEVIGNIHDNPELLEIEK